MILNKKAEKYIRHAEEYLITQEFTKALDNLIAAIKIDPQCTRVAFIREPLYNQLIELALRGQADRDALIGQLLCREMWNLLPKELIVDAGKLKDLIFTSLVGMEDRNLQKMALLQALSPYTFLGSLFYIQRWWTKPSLAKGHLANIARLLERTFIEDAAFTLPLDSMLAQAIKTVPGLVDLDNFPMLYNIVDAHQERTLEIQATVHYGRTPFWSKIDHTVECVYDGYRSPRPVEKPRSYSV